MPPQANEIRLNNKDTKLVGQNFAVKLGKCLKDQ